MIKLKNLSNDKNIYFKFKTNKPNYYIVRPSKGVIMPDEVTGVKSELLEII